MFLKIMNTKLSQSKTEVLVQTRYRYNHSLEMVNMLRWKKLRKNIFPLNYLSFKCTKFLNCFF